MKQQIKSKLPQWWRNTNCNYKTVCSNDLDGLLSTAILKYICGWHIGYYNDFHFLYGVTDERIDSTTRVWVDVARLTNEKCFDNHVAKATVIDFENPNAINPNQFAGVTNENYYYKYCGSTALMLWSLYHLPLPKTDRGKMLLLSIDSAFKGYYGNDTFRKSHEYFVGEVFGFKELLEFESKHTDREFYKLITDMGSTQKVKINKGGQLTTDLPVEEISELLGVPITLPDKEFTKIDKYEYAEVYKQGVKSIAEFGKNIVTLAFVGKDKVRYSYRRTQKDERIYV